MINSWNYHL